MNPQTHYALIVGIDKYPEFRSLRGAEGDAHDFEDWLVGQGVPRGAPGQMGIPGAGHGNTTKLVSSSYAINSVYDAKPVGQQIHDWLSALDGAAAGAANVDFPLGERVYVVFACHGYNSSTAQQTAIMPSTRLDYWDVIPLVPLLTYLQTKAYFREIVLISDACRDQVDYAVDPIWPRRPQTHPNAAQVKVFQAYAAKAGQKAVELDFGGKYRGVLSQAFLQGVGGIAADAQGDVWADRLNSHLRFAVAAKLGPNASPSIEAPEPPADRLLLCQTAQRQPKLVVEPQGEKAGIATLVRKTDLSESPVDLAQGVQAFLVPAGVYSLRTPAGKEYDVIAAWEETHVLV